MPGIIQWTSYKGQEILLNNRSNLNDTDIIENSNQVVKLIKESG
jgi:hypothetical protein